MIDSLYRSKQDAFWDRLGGVLARRGVSPDAVTKGAFLLSTLNSFAFLVHRNFLAYGLLLAMTELLDNLDGAVARVSGRKTRYGAFLDAATDRYKESLSLFVVAWVTGYWVACFAAVTGSLLTSYNRARAAVEGAQAAATGLDLFERFERVATLVLGLVLSPLLPPSLFLGRDALWGALVLIGILSHLTSVQRVWRARRVLRELDRGSSSPFPRA
ncbi:MAG: CDP-alcohol phosphatidyltransferase family protein [Vicinamibacteria bacterium]|nr:CDP-alcohol phosphatidyltransferase family protein [Vicinamibacteria bacterium]